ncbi:unnamed protein product [Caenorhabditis nigoni]
MRIRSYPNLVNRQIIQQMDPSTNFMLSKTSKKMKSLVKNYIYKVDQVWINSSSNVSFVIEISEKIYNVLVLSDDAETREKIGYSFLINTALLHSLSRYDYREIISNHNNICEVFKCESNRISLVDSPKEFIEVDVDVENYNRFFMNVDFCILRILGNPSRMCMKVPHLMIDDARNHVINFMCYYAGENIVLKNAWMDDDTIRMFILNWTWKAKQSLVSFIAFQDGQEVFDESSIVTLLNSKRDTDSRVEYWFTDSRVEDWDPEKRDRYFKYDSIIANHHVLPADTLDCEHGYDIVREDGKRASVKISPNYFMFFVWP